MAKKAATRSKAGLFSRKKLAKKTRKSWTSTSSSGSGNREAQPPQPQAPIPRHSIPS